MIRKLLSLMILCSFYFMGFAQQTGSFNQTVTLNDGDPAGPNRTISFYVPTTYNASHAYKLVVGLHGAGDNSANFRNAVLPLYTNTSCPLYNAILVCPDGGNDPSRCFDVPNADTAMITLALNAALSQYNIDTSQIYLNGFSLGGRSALHYGLLNWWKFRGMFLWSPAIQSLNDANNLGAYPSLGGSWAVGAWAYQNSRMIPICITVGTADGYDQTVTTAYNNMLDSGGIVSLYPILGMGHSVPSIQKAFECITYADTNSYDGTLDAGIYNIPSPPPVICDINNVTPVINLKNYGQTPLTSATISYLVDGSSGTINWTGSLNRLARSNVALPTQNFSSGSHVITASVASPNGGTDGNPSNNSKTYNFTNNPFSLPVVEGFQENTFPPPGWSIYNPDHDDHWMLNLTYGSKGTNQSAYFNNCNPKDTLHSLRDQIRTTIYDFSGATSSAELTFDVAYAPFSTYNSDTLAVYYSTDCATTWTQIYLKGGATLATVPCMINDTATCGTYTDGWSCFEPTSSDAWRTDIINLGSLAGQSSVMFAFENRSGFGENLFLDNINILSGAVAGIKETSLDNTVSVYPNPAGDQLTIIGLKYNKGTIIDIYDVLGQKMLSPSILSETEISINVQDLAAGVYLIRLQTEGNEGVLVKRFVKK